MMGRVEIVQMTVPERLALIGALWDSLDEAETPLPTAQFEELQRRLGSFDHDRAEAVSWEHLRTELMERAR